MGKKEKVFCVCRLCCWLLSDGLLSDYVSIFLSLGCDGRQGRGESHGGGHNERVKCSVVGERDYSGADDNSTFFWVIF
jgi:hypothetical protein